MDVRDINKTYVAKNCERTAGNDAAIDGNAVVGVQIHAPLDDTGVPATTYYGPGELLITDVSGRALTRPLVIAEGKTIPEIVIHQRSSNGNNFYPSPALKGASITSYNFTPFEEAVEHVAVVSNIDNTKTNFSYMVKIRRVGTDNYALKQTTVKTAYFKSAPGGNTVTEIVTGLADYINKNFNMDPLVPIAASVTGAANEELTITALPYPFVEGKTNYEKLNFVVEILGYDADVAYNDKDDLTTATDTYLQATKGAGNYPQVVTMDDFGKLYSGANKDLQSPVYRRNIVDSDVPKFQSDGITPVKYDTIVLNWTHAQGDFSMNVRQEGSLTIFLPVEDNATNQVGVANIGVVDVLDAYIVDVFGIGVDHLGDLTP